MTPARGIALGALAVAVIVVAVILLGGGDTRTYKLRFENAGQLVKDDDVQVGGRRIGSIRKIELTSDNQAEITVEVKAPYAPLHAGTTATIRATSLSGVANRYIALTPAPNSAPELADGAILAQDKTTSPVDLDELFDTLDAKTRKGLQQVIQGTAAQYQGSGRQANEAAKYFNPVVSTSARLVNEVDRDQQAFEDVIVYGAKVTTALAERAPTITALVDHTAQTTGAIGAEQKALGTTLDLLPDTLKRANSTFVNLRATLTDLDKLTDASLPATKKLAPLLRDLRPLVADARPTIHDLRLLVTRPGANNDLIELLNKAPQLESLAKPTFAHSIDALKQAEPVVSFIRPYTADFVGWLRDFGQDTANYDANGHYARIQPIFNAFSFTSNPAGGVLRAIPNSDRLTGLDSGNLTRCPGAATQTATDGSNVWRDSDGTLDCDPTQTLQGP